MIKALDHIGVAVESLGKALDFYASLGMKPSGFDEADQSKIAFLPLPGTRIELLEGLTPESPVSKFVAKRGPGIHHLCYEVEDIQAAFREIKASGAQVIEPAPRPGAHGCTVFFVHPRSTGGVLIEFSQRPTGP